MSESVSGAITLAVFLLLTAGTFLFLVNVWEDQGVGIKEMSSHQEERGRTAISIESVSGTSADCPSFIGPFNVSVVNTGEISYGDYSQMDALVDYTDGSNNRTATHLVHGTDWTIASITPDVGDPNTWNSRETATIAMTMSTPMKLQTRGTFVMVTPQGVSDRTYFTCTPTHYYLQNNPTPPTGDTNSQAVLPMGPTAPSTVTLYNYDLDRDSQAGLLVAAGGSGPDESDPTRYQVWRSGPLLDSLSIESASIDFWSGIEDFTLGVTGSTTLYLREFDGSGHTEMGNSTVFAGDWQGGVNNFVEKTANINDIDCTVAEGNELEIKLMVDPASSDNLWFAYDTTSYQSIVRVIPAAASTPSCTT